jgi:thiamine-phosphate pyrophosphorylase
MPPKCVLYYITDRSAFPGDEPTRRRRLLEKIREAAHAGVDYIQLRETDLSTRELESLAREAVAVVRAPSQSKPTLLINSRTDVALAVQADGVHLRSDDIDPQDVRTAWTKCAQGKCGEGTPAGQNSPRAPLIGVSCHSPEEVAKAAVNGATFAVCAPVFGKKDALPTGLSLLKEACLANIPVLALGGITILNAQSCLDAGAAGIAGIRLFQENEIATVMKQLRG